MTITAEAARSIAAAFQSRWIQGYVRGKLTRDVIYAAVADSIEEHSLPLLDIGCGIGLVSHYLDAQGVKITTVGIDHDVRKVITARHAAQRRRLDATFFVGDARMSLRFRGNVLLLDVLHYFPWHDQRRILASAAEATARGGRLIIRDCMRDSTWRYRVTVTQERFSKLIGWLRGEVLEFPTIAGIHDELAAAGMRAVETRPLWGSTPFNNYLLLFERA